MDMNPDLTDILGLPFPSVGMIRSNLVPGKARVFGQGKWSCVMSLAAQAFLGHTVAFQKNTVGCLMGRRALGFGDPLANPPFPRRCMDYFLSQGNRSWKTGRMVAASVGWAEKTGLCPPGFSETFLEGEGFKSDYRTAREFLNALPVKNEKGIVILKPLTEFQNDEEPAAVLIYATTLQLSVLASLLHYKTGNQDRLRFAPYSECQGFFAFAEETKTRVTQALVFGIDLQARSRMSTRFSLDLMGLSLPWPLYRDILEAALDPSCFVNKESLREVLKTMPQPSCPSAV